MDEKAIKEVYDVIERLHHLEEQKSNPTRDGMLKALLDARQLAPLEIITVEYSQGDVYPTPWASFSDNDLYRKLPQYQQGLITYCVNKYGKVIFERLLKEYNNPK